MTRERIVLGPVRDYRFQGSQLWVGCDGLQTQVTFLKPELVRIRIAPGGEFSPGHSWDVAKPDSDFDIVPLDLKHTSHAILLHSSAFTVRVDKATAWVDMLTPHGKSFFTDLESPVWEESRFCFTKRMEENEHYYGFGERGGRMEKRGQSMRNWTTDPNQPHGAFVDPMYMAIPVYMALQQGNAYGVFVNCTEDSTFDLSHADQLRFSANGKELDLYLAYGPHPMDVIAHLSDLLGKMPLPPRWALGFHQSRWSYGSETEVRHIAEAFRKKEIPCDTIHLDIDYMDGYRVFTWNKHNFPDPEKLNLDLQKLGFHSVAIIDPGVKVDKKYDVYANGIENDVFVRNADGTVVDGYVWPDQSVFPDFSRPEVRRWWGKWQNRLTASGVSGIWNDMNEPAVFGKPFSEGGGEGGTLPLEAIQGPDGEKSTHAVLHNLYGSQMAQASYEAMQAFKPDQRSFHLCRSGFAGIQRWTASWMGDNGSCWEHLDMSLGQLINMGISAVPFVGVDIGGFFGNATPELFARWVQIGSLYPFSRAHTCIATEAHEPWAFGKEVEEIAREYISLRYRLLPYLYSIFQSASEHGYPIWRSLFLHYPHDERTYQIADQVLIGEHLMAAPITRPGQLARQVYLPQGVWYDWWEGTAYQGGRYILAEAPLQRMPMYVRAGAVIPLGPVAHHTKEKGNDPLTLLCFPGEGGSFNLYEDDGFSLNYRNGQYCTTAYHIESDEKTACLAIATRTGDYEVADRKLIVILRDGRQYQQKEVMDRGQEMEIIFERL